MMAENSIKKFVGICKFDRTETDIKKTVGEKGFGHRQYKNGAVILTYLRGKLDGWKSQ